MGVLTSRLRHRPSCPANDRNCRRVPQSASKMHWSHLFLTGLGCKRVFQRAAWLIRLILLICCHIRAKRNNTGSYTFMNPKWDV